MIQPDTIKLLRECDAGIQMGTNSIREVLPYVRSASLKKHLNDCRQEHDRLAKEVREQLARFRDEGKAPDPIAQSMSWIKTNMKLMLNESDQAIAGLMTDGCNMGIKSLNHYLNQYEAADEVSKDIAKRLINQEERLALNIRQFL